MFYALQRALSLAALIVILKIFLPDVAHEAESILLSALRIVATVLASLENADYQPLADYDYYDF